MLARRNQCRVPQGSQHGLYLEARILLHLVSWHLISLSAKASVNSFILAHLTVRVSIFIKRTIPLPGDEESLKFQLALHVMFQGLAVAVLFAGANARSRPHNASLPSLQDGTLQHRSQWQSTQDMAAYNLGLLSCTPPTEQAPGA
jgi:hypothetical protein